MKERFELMLFAGILTIILTTCVYIFSSYDRMWLNLEVIIIPLVYIIGYEILMEKQVRYAKTDYDELNEEINILKRKAFALEKEIYY